MNLLITGGFGHIGSHIIANINKIEKIKKLYIIDNIYNNKPNSLFNIKKTKTKIYLFNKDLSQKNSLKSFPKVDIVLHLASMTDAEKSIMLKKKIHDNNMGIFNNIINYCEQNSSKLIHLSSTSVYGQLSGYLDESLKRLTPQTPYAKIKLNEEEILKSNKKINYLSFRFGTIAGISPGMRFHTAVNKFCISAVLNQPIPVWTSALNQFRPYLSLGDAFKAIKFTIENDKFDNKVYNVLTSNLTVKHIVEMIKKYKKNVKINYVKSKIKNQLSYKINDSRFKRNFFKLNGNIQNDVKKTIQLFNNINR
jgi:UDP-glucose 4-epimerase